MLCSLLSAALLFAPALRAEESAAVRARRAADKILSYYSIPHQKPELRAEEVELGRLLFFDKRLSKGGVMSCSTCHLPEKGFGDGLPRARGRGGAELARNTPSLLNAAYQAEFRWDGRAKSIEEASLIALTNPVELGQDRGSVVKSVRAVPDYVRRFARVYGKDRVSEDRVIAALASFVRSLEPSEPSPFDRFASDLSALSPAAQEGLLLFTGKAGCKRCHTDVNPRGYLGANLTDSGYHNTGVRRREPDDLGRFAVDPSSANRRAFRTPPLRNLTLTAPYMHDGSLATLRDVVDFYERGGDDHENQDARVFPLDLTEREKEALVALLESLTSPAPREAKR